MTAKERASRDLCLALAYWREHGEVAAEVLQLALDAYRKRFPLEQRGRELLERDP